MFYAVQYIYEYLDLYLSKWVTLVAGAYRPAHWAASRTSSNWPPAAVTTPTKK